MNLAGSGTLTTSATPQIVSSNRNGSRVGIAISNYGATTAWINPSNTQVAGVAQGIPIYAHTTWYDNSSENYICWQGTITAVDDGAAGATTLAFWERVKD